MNKHLFFSAILAMAFYACGPVYVIRQDPPPPAAAPTPPPPPEPEPDASYQSFYDDLSPYGQWVDNPQYGYVWLPDAGPDFKPYATNGHWVYTDDGWTWSSDYPWGWAAFHYGRWFFQDGYGWMWVPGNEWAPAWVSWRDNDDYYGWAPLGPGIGFESSYAGGGYAPPAYYWSFVPHRYVTSPQIRSYYVNESRNVTIINNTTIINYNSRNNNSAYTRNTAVRNANYGRGPDPDQVGRFTGAPVRPIAIRTGNTPGEQVRDGGMFLFRPRINANPRNNNPGNGGTPPRMAPRNAQPLNNARPVNTTIYNRGDHPVNNQSNQPAPPPPSVNQPNPPGRPIPPPPSNPPGQQPSSGRPFNNRPAAQGQPNSNNPPNGSSQPNQPAPPVTPPNPPAGRPTSPPPSNPPGQQPSSGRPFNNRPVIQGQPNSNNQSNNNSQPNQPAPPVNPPNPSGGRPTPPARQPLNRPLIPAQNPQPAVQPGHLPVNQQNNRTPFFNHTPPARQTPPVQQRQQRPTPPPPPPPPPKKDPEKKDGH